MAKRSPPSPQPVDVYVRIHDVHHEGEATDRFSRRLTLMPGANPIAISLKDVKFAPETRAMNMRRVRSVMLFANAPEQAIELYLGDFRLER